MTATSDLAAIALAASAYESIDSATTVETVHKVVANAETMRMFARQTKNPQLEDDLNKIRLYAEVRIFELTSKPQSEPA